jgi:hypothetical protein
MTWKQLWITWPETYPGVYEYKTKAQPFQDKEALPEQKASQQMNGIRAQRGGGGELTQKCPIQAWRITQLREVGASKFFEQPCSTV